MVADQELDGGGIGVALDRAVQRKVEVCGDVQDVPLLCVQIAQIDYVLQHIHRCLTVARETKRSPTNLVVGEELGDCSLGKKLLDAREYLFPRLAPAEHVQRQVVLNVRRDKSPENRRCRTAR